MGHSMQRRGISVQKMTMRNQSVGSRRTSGGSGEMAHAGKLTLPGILMKLIPSNLTSPNRRGSSDGLRECVLTVHSNGLSNGIDHTNGRKMFDRRLFPKYRDMKSSELNSNTTVLAESGSAPNRRGEKFMVNEVHEGSLRCRFCNADLAHIVLDLGMSPLCQTHIEHDQLNMMEPFYPLRAYLCVRCFLLQLGEYIPPERIFSEYAYFSSYSDTWLRHAQAYTEMMVERFELHPGSKVVEIASNDGYLLQYFLKQNIPVLGIEPAAN